MIILIRNECYKMLMKKKLLLIGVLLLLFIGLFAYGEQYVYARALTAFGADEGQGGLDWRVLARQQIEKSQGRLDSPYIPESGLKAIEIQIAQLEYFLAHDINPVTPSAARFAVDFADQSLALFFPLLILILGADLVSGEFAKGTIKVLLTRPVARWKILMAKYLALVIMTTLVLALAGGLATLISGLYFGNWGFGEPVATGFGLVNGSLTSDGVILIPRWQYMGLIYALAWLASMSLAALVTLASVLVKTTASAIGIMMAALIGGQFLQYFLSDWPVVKYFFVSNLDLSKYLTGSFQPIPGMSLGFSMAVLAAWSIAALSAGFAVFVKRDVLV